MMSGIIRKPEAKFDEVNDTNKYNKSTEVVANSRNFLSQNLQLNNVEHINPMDKNGETPQSMNFPMTPKTYLRVNNTGTISKTDIREDELDKAQRTHSLNEFSAALLVYKAQKKALKEAESTLFSLFRSRRMLDKPGMERRSTAQN